MYVIRFINRAGRRCRCYIDASGISHALRSFAQTHNVNCFVCSVQYCGTPFTREEC